MYASLAQHSSLASSLHHHTSSVKTSFSSSCSSDTRAALCRSTTTGLLCGATGLYAPLPFPHITMQICGFSEVSSLRSEPCVRPHSTQELGLLVKSWRRVPRGAKNSNKNIWASRFHSAHEAFDGPTWLLLHQCRHSCTFPTEVLLVQDIRM